jgi:hypothetical protein
VDGIASLHPLALLGVAGLVLSLLVLAVLAANDRRA